jgi:hypothetical protein
MLGKLVAVASLARFQAPDDAMVLRALRNSMDPLGELEREAVFKSRAGL